MWQLILACMIATLVMAGPVQASVTSEPFGTTADGTPVTRYTMKNLKGMTVKLMTLGATVTEISVPDKNGKFANVVLGFDDVAGYQSDKNQYFGCTTGRVANRIAKGMFTLEGKEYKLAVNNGPNHLHGGVKRSLDKVVWKADVGKELDLVIFSYTSPDGEEGYPGKLDISVHFFLFETNQLQITYRAKTDKATPVNLTNHSYFNLAGAGADTVLDHELMIAADRFLPTDDTLIPTGKIEPVKGTVLDFNKLTRIGERIDKLVDTPFKGYDHCYVLTQRSREPTLAAKLRDPSSGRLMTVLTTEPGIQFYTGNYLAGQKGKDGKEYKQRSALCLETQHFPDAVNQPTFASIILRPGSEYRHMCVYGFAAE